MTRNELNRALSAILLTLSEEGHGSAPSGILYAALQTSDPELYTLDAYNRVIGIMQRAELATLDEYHIVEITDAGRKLARDIRADIDARRTGRA